MAKVLYDTSANRLLGVEVNPEIPRKQTKTAPDGNGPVPRHDEFGFGEPTMMADRYRMLEENFDRQMNRIKSHFDRQGKTLGELTEKMGAINQR